MSPNDQLTDGGPSLTRELPDSVAGLPFGAAPFFLLAREVAKSASVEECGSTSDPRNKE